MIDRIDDRIGSKKSFTNYVVVLLDVIYEPLKLISTSFFMSQSLLSYSYAAAM